MRNIEAREPVICCILLHWIGNATQRDWLTVLRAGPSVSADWYWHQAVKKWLGRAEERAIITIWNEQTVNPRTRGKGHGVQRLFTSPPSSTHGETSKTLYIKSSILRHLLLLTSATVELLYVGNSIFGDYER